MALPRATLQLHWPLPKRMGLISTKRILASRWGTSLVPEPYYTASGVTSTTYTVTSAGAEVYSCMRCERVAQKQPFVHCIVVIDEQLLDYHS